MENYSKSFANLCIAAVWAGVHGFITDQQKIQLEFYYPIIVFQGPIYDVRVRGGEIDIRPTDHVLFHHSASVGGQVLLSHLRSIAKRTCRPRQGRRALKRLDYLAR